MKACFPIIVCVQNLTTHSDFKLTLQEGHLDLVKYLLENGALVNAQTGTGDTALTYACENGHTDVSDLLLQYNAELVRKLFQYQFIR